MDRRRRDRSGSAVSSSLKSSAVSVKSKVGNYRTRFIEVSLSDYLQQSPPEFQSFVHIYPGLGTARAIRKNIATLEMFEATCSNEESKKYYRSIMRTTDWPVPHVTLGEGKAFSREIARHVFKPGKGSNRFYVAQIPRMNASATVAVYPKGGLYHGIVNDPINIHSHRWAITSGHSNFVTNALLTTQDWLLDDVNADRDLVQLFKHHDVQPVGHRFGVPSLNKLHKCPAAVADARIQEAVALTSDCTRRNAIAAFTQIQFGTVAGTVTIDEVEITITDSEIGDGHLKTKDCRIWRLIHAYSYDDGVNLNLSNDVKRWLVVLLAWLMSSKLKGDGAVRTTDYKKNTDIKKRLPFLKKFIPVIRAVVDVFACDVMPNMYYPSRSDRDLDEILVRKVRGVKDWLVAIDPIAAAVIPSVVDVYRLTLYKEQPYNCTFCGAPGTSGAASAVCKVSLQGPFRRHSRAVGHYETKHSEADEANAAAPTPFQPAREPGDLLNSDPRFAVFIGVADTEFQDSQFLVSSSGLIVWEDGPSSTLPYQDENSPPQQHQAPNVEAQTNNMYPPPDVVDGVDLRGLEHDDESGEDYLWTA